MVSDKSNEGSQNGCTDFDPGMRNARHDLRVAVGQASLLKALGARQVRFELCENDFGLSVCGLTHTEQYFWRSEAGAET